MRSLAVLAQALRDDSQSEYRVKIAGIELVRLQIRLPGLIEFSVAIGSIGLAEYRIQRVRLALLDKQRGVLPSLPVRFNRGSCRAFCLEVRLRPTGANLRA